MIRKNGGGQRKIQIIIVIILIAILQLIAVSFVNAQNNFSKNKILLKENSYIFGDIIEFTVISQENSILEIENNNDIFKFLGEPNGNQKFIPESKGFYTLRLLSEDRQTILAVEDFEVIEENNNILENYQSSNVSFYDIESMSEDSIIVIRKEIFFVGEEVIIDVNNKTDDFDLTIITPTNTYTFLGELTDDFVSFYPSENGTYEVKYIDREKTESIQFVVEEILENELQKKKDSGFVIIKSIFSLKGMQTGKMINVKDSKGNSRIIDLNFYEKEEINDLLFVATKERPGVVDINDTVALQEQAVKQGGLYDVDVLVNDDSIKNIKLRNLIYTQGIEISYESLEKSKVSIPNREVGSAYSINLENVPIEDAIATGIARGRELWKCKDWNFSTQECFGTWEKYKDITPGQPYEILLEPGDPGFAETNITIINVQSYPSYKGNWTVQFTTHGTANLSIKPVQGTTWINTDTQGYYDLKFLSIKCDGLEQNYSWINDSVFIENYFCNSTGFETSQTLTKGEHYLEFSFGDDVVIAKNDVNDFKIQRGTTTITQSNNSATITAGSNYVAPATLNKSFIRITNTRLSGAGADNTGANNQDPGETNVYINNPENLLTNITFQRYQSPAAYTTRVDWEIIEYIGESGGLNEFIVRDEDFVENTGSVIDGISTSVNDNSKVVVFITGQAYSDTINSAYDRALFTSEWVSISGIPRFTRGDGTGTAGVSYAVVEFTGNNWKVQRIPYAYTSSSTWETTTINQVNAVNRTFLHSQMRTDSGNLDEQGQQVYLFNTTNLYLKLRDTATANQNAVVWIIENNQTDGTPMLVRTYQGTRSSGGTEPDYWTHTINEVSSLSTTSIMGETSDSSGGGTTVPRGPLGLIISDNITVNMFRSDTGQNQDYTFLVVEWPTAPPDVTPPNILIISPENTTYQYGYMDYNISLDEEADTCTYSVNGGTNVSMNAINETYFNGTSNFLQNGDYNVTFYCNDTSNNNGTSEVRNFTINVPYPSITVNSPHNITYTSSIVDFNVTLNIDGDWCAFSLDDAPNVSMTKNIPTFFTYQQSGLSDGEHDLIFSCNSTFSGMNRTELLEFRVDTQLPQVDLLYPKNNTGTYITSVSKLINLSANITETSPDECSLYFDGLLNQTKAVTQGENNFSVDALVGQHTWYVNCTDLSGQYNSSPEYSFSVIEYSNILQNLEGQDLSNVIGLTAITSDVKIVFNNTDLSGIYNLSSEIFSSLNSAEVDSTTYSGLNSSAEITFYNLSFLQTPIIFVDDTICSDCIVRSYGSGTLVFEVMHFSKYVASANSQLMIWDETDPQEGSQSKFADDQILFYTNYTNITSGNSISGGSVFCEIEFNDSTLENMSYNATNELYYYNYSFSTPDLYVWNVTCDGSSSGYETLYANDTVAVSQLFGWGISSSAFTASSTHTTTRCMGGDAPTGQTGMEINFIWYRSVGSGTAAVSVYYGGVESDPAGATLQEEVINQAVVAGWNQFNLSSPLAWNDSQVTWLCWKQADGAGAYYSSSNADAGDFYTSHGRHDDGGGTPTISFPSTLSTANLGNFWYSIYAEYTNNSKPSVPTDISCDGTTNCDIEVDSSVTLEATGSVDLETDIITYFLEAYYNATDSSLYSTNTMVAPNGAGTPVNIFDDLESGFGNWSNVAGDNYDWTRDQGGTTSSNTGPSVDHTLGTATGWYAYTETSSPVVAGNQFYLEGPSFEAGSISSEMNFWYHMYLGNTGNTDTLLALDIFDGTSWTLSEWNQTGEHGNTWFNAVVNLSNYTDTITPRLRMIVGSTGTNIWQNDVAVDDINITTRVMTSGVDTNSSTLEFTDTGIGFSSVEAITLTFEIDYYDATISEDASSSNPDLEISVFDGSSYVHAGILNLSTLYTGTGNQTDNKIVKLLITNPTVLNAWKLQENQDIKVTGFNLDFNSTYSDNIVLANQRTDITGIGWVEIGNHTEGNTFYWNTKDIIPQTCINLRSRAVDLDGGQLYSDYYTENNCLNITHPTYFYNPELNVTLLNHTDDVRFNITVIDSSGIDEVNATIKYPDNSLQNFSLQNAGGDLYFFVFNNTEYTGTYNITRVYALDSQGTTEYQDYSDVTFEVSLSYPEAFNLLTPMNNTVSSNLLPNLTWEQSSDSYFANYTILLDKDPLFDSVDFEYYTIGITNTSRVVDFALDGLSAYYWRVIAQDIYGAKTNSTNDYVYITDNQKPSITLNNPFNLEKLLSYEVLFNFTPLDNSDMDTCVLYGNFSGFFSAIESNSTIINNQPNQITATLSTQGDHNWTIWCNDTAGNDAFATENRTFNLDVSGPVITVVGPANNTYENESNIINFTIIADDLHSDVAFCNIYYNSTLGSTESFITDGVPFNFTGFLNNGNYYWYVSCTDTNGFESTSSTYNIETDVIDNDGPLISLNYPAENGYINEQNVTFNYTPFDATGLINCTMYFDGVENETCGVHPGYYNNSPKAESGLILLDSVTTNTITLNQPYNKSKSFIIRRYTMLNDDSSNEPDGATATIQWANCSGEICNQLTATRDASDAEDLVASYSIMQANNIKSTDFSLSWSSGQNSTSLSVSLPSDYASKCFVNLHRGTKVSSASVNAFAENEIRSNITSTSNIDFERFPELGQTAAPSITLGEVVCFLDNTSVQNVFRTFTEGNAVTENILISSIDTSRTWSIHNHRQADSGVGQNAVWSDLTSNTNLQLYVDENGDAGTNQQPQVSAYVIEFENNMNSSVSLIDIATAVSDQNISSSIGFEVDLNRTLLQCYNSMAAGGGTAHTRDFWVNSFDSNSSINSINYRTRLVSQLTEMKCWIVEWPVYTTYDTGEEVDDCLIKNFEDNFFDITNLSEGQHNWSVSCIDNSSSENVGTSENWNFTIDASNPTVVLNVPANNTFLGNKSVAFNYTPSDANLDSCVLYENSSGLWLPSVTNLTPSSDTSNILRKSLNDGDYIWNVYCNDSSGRFAIAEFNNTVHIDSQAPTYYNIFTQPISPQAYSLLKLFEFNATWFDNYNVDTVLFEHNFSGLAFNYSTFNPVANTYSYNITGIPAGTYYYKWHANDSLNNINSTNAITYVVQKAASQINLLLDGSSSNLTINEDNYVNISALMTTPLEGYSEIYLDGALINQGPVPLENLTLFSDPGYHNVTQIYNASQNYSSSKKSLFITVNDITSPIVTSIFPEPGDFIGSSSFALQYNVTDKISIQNCSLFIDDTYDQTSFNVTVNSTVYFSKTLSDGNYTWYVDCYDSAGNMGTSGEQNFSLIKSDFIVMNVSSESTYEKGSIAIINSLTQDIFSSPMDTSVSLVITTNNTTTGWWNTDWSKRKPLSINETSGNNATDGLILLNLTGLNGAISSCQNEIRIIDYAYGGGGVETPRIIDAGDNFDWCTIRFKANLTGGESNTSRFYVYYGNVFASSPSYSGNFQLNLTYEDLESGFGNWTNAVYDDADWTRDQGGTVSTGTGPDVDHTLGNATGWYAYTETSSPIVAGDIFVLEGPDVDAENNTLTLNFWYHMLLGSNTDTNLSLDIYNGTAWVENYWSMIGDQGAVWTNAQVNLGSFTGTIRPRFRVVVGSTGSTWQNDVALDDLRFISFESKTQGGIAGNQESFIDKISGTTGIDGLYDWPWNTTLRNYGNYTAIGVARKVNFTSSSDYTKFEIVPDTTPPNITLISPADYAEYGVGDRDMVYSVYDINLANCTLYHDVYGTFNSNETHLTPTNNNTNTFTNIYFNLGLHEWNIGCYDTQGNFGFALQNYTLNITGPDLTTFVNKIWFEGGSIIEGLEEIVYANITNVGLTDNNESFTVQLYNGDPDLGGTQINGNYTVGNLSIGEEVTINSSFILDAGINNIFVLIDVDDVINESDEMNNKINNSLQVPLYHYYYGNFSKNIILGSSNNSFLYSFQNGTTENTSANVYFADTDSVFSFTDLVPISRNTLGNPTGDDFANIDAVLNTSLFNDSIKIIWGADTEIPVQLEDFNISGNIVANVPVTNSTNNTAFRTGILWDSDDDNSFNLQYDVVDKEDLVFVTKINRSQQGRYGTYDFEIRIPALLREYASGIEKVAFYVEIV